MLEFALWNGNWKVLHGEIKLRRCVLLVHFSRKMLIAKRNLNVKEWWCVKPERFLSLVFVLFF